MSEHREHLLPGTEDISCRGSPTVGLHADMRQRIYRWPRSSRARPSRQIPARHPRGHALSGRATAGGKVAVAGVPTVVAGGRRQPFVHALDDQ